MLNFGIRLNLFVGPSVPVPAPVALIESLVSLEVQNRDHGRDGFQVNFTLGRGKGPSNFELLAGKLLEPQNRLVVMMLINSNPVILIDGIITQHQVVPSSRPGDARLVITGEDVSLKLDLIEKQATYPNQADSIIVTRLLAEYAASIGLVPSVTPTTDVPIIVQRVPAQRGTDLQYISHLAERNSHVFYIEPVTVGVNKAYWGPDTRQGTPQPALTMNMDAHTNVTSMNFRFNALAPSEPTSNVLQQGQKVKAPPSPALRLPLSSDAPTPMRKILPSGTAGLSMTQAGLRSRQEITQSSDATECTGELDTARYMNVLRARRLVGVRGCGLSYDGLYYVKQVTHHITRSSYRQSFTLVREGRGSTVPGVPV